MSSIFLPAIALQPFLFLPLAFIAGEKPKLSQQKAGRTRQYLGCAFRRAAASDYPLMLHYRLNRVAAG